MRLFIAVLFDDKIKGTLLRAVSDLRAQADTGVFTRPENLHLTLAFLGEARGPAAANEAICAAAGDRFPLTVGGCGRFGDLWWAGVRETPPLSALSRRLRRELTSRNVSFDQKPFRPHITLARQLQAAEPVRISVPEQTMTVSRVSLMKSERVCGKMVYTEIGGCDLK